MDIQCIALDLDRTTLDAQGRLSPANRQALEHAISKGVHIVIASGRAFRSLPRDVVSVPASNTPSPPTAPPSTTSPPADGSTAIRWSPGPCWTSSA